MAISGIDVISKIIQWQSPLYYRHRIELVNAWGVKHAVLSHTLPAMSIDNGKYSWRRNIKIYRGAGAYSSSSRVIWRAATLLMTINDY